MADQKGGQLVSPRTSAGSELASAELSGRRSGCPRREIEKLFLAPRRALTHAPCSGRSPAPRLAADGARHPGRTHALSAPEVVGCSCAAAPGAGGGAAAAGGVNGSPLQLYLHLAAARTLRHGRTAHQRWVPSGSRWSSTRDPRGRGAARPGAWVLVPGLPPPGFEAGCQGFVTGGPGSLPPAPEPQVATSCCVLRSRGGGLAAAPSTAPGRTCWSTDFRARGRHKVLFSRLVGTPEIGGPRGGADPE